MQQASEREMAMCAKYAAEMAQLNKQIETMQAEVVTMSDETFTHENVLLQQTSRSQAILSKNQQLADFNRDLEDRVAHQKSLLKTLEILQED